MDDELISVLSEVEDDDLGVNPGSISIDYLIDWLIGLLTVWFVKVATMLYPLKYTDLTTFDWLIDSLMLLLWHHLDGAQIVAQVPKEYSLYSNFIFPEYTPLF